MTDTDAVTGRSGLHRRAFLRGAALAGAGTAVGTGLPGLVQRSAFAHHGAPPGAGADSDYGPLSPKRPVAASDAANANVAYLALPDGFAYTVFGVEGQRMSDGNRTPRAHDGMAAFLLPDDRIRLVRNHEDRSDAAASRAEGGARARPAYDRLGRGATTTLEIGFTPEGYPIGGRDVVSIAGTIVNCAGGATPWGSWLTCEETTAGTGAGFAKAHGYVFEVPADRDEPASPTPLEDLGRFVHEAAAVDPRTGAVYLTEDNDPAGLYRFLPHRPGNLRAGGRLQMLAVDGEPRYDTRDEEEEGRHLPVRWVDIADPDLADAEDDPLAVYRQGAGEGGAAFRRLEGCWYGNGAVYVNSTSGGPAGFGQVWEYRPSSNPDFGELTLLVVAEHGGVLDAPDNVTVSDRGGVLVCEDGGGGNFLRGVRATGETYDFAHNELNAREWAGACFATSAAFRERFPETGGQILFVNIQGALSPGESGDLGHTFAIWGPWTAGSL